MAKSMEECTGAWKFVDNQAMRFVSWELLKGLRSGAPARSPKVAF